MLPVMVAVARLEQPQECLLGAHRHPLGNKGLAIRGQAVDAPAVAVHEVDQDPRYGNGYLLFAVIADQRPPAN
jgi:hypothetical protein